MSVDQSEEASQKWKYSNGRTSESWPKVEATAMGSSRQKIESIAEKGAVMITHVLSGWLAASYPIRRVFLQHISGRVFVEYVINKGKSCCHFAWKKNGSMFVYPTNMAMILDLKGFLISQKLFERKFVCEARKFFSALFSQDNFFTNRRHKSKGNCSIALKFEQ